MEPKDDFFNRIKVTQNNGDITKKIKDSGLYVPEMPQGMQIPGETTIDYDEFEALVQDYRKKFTIEINGETRTDFWTMLRMLKNIRVTEGKNISHNLRQLLDDIQDMCKDENTDILYGVMHLLKPIASILKSEELSSRYLNEDYIEKGALSAITGLNFQRGYHFNEAEISTLESQWEHAINDIFIPKEHYREPTEPSLEYIE